MQMACAWASASIAAASDMPLSLSSICLVIEWANAGPRASRSAQSRASGVSSASGTTRLTKPMLRACSAEMRSPKKKQLAARPRPTMRGSRYEAPMSAPERPTFGKMKPKRAPSDATPQIARGGDHRARAHAGAMDGGEHRAAQLADALDERAGDARELEQPAGVAREELGDDALDVAARAEAAPAPREHHARTRARSRGRGRSRELAVDLEGERVEALGPVQRDGATPVSGARE
jgi:hypothetical protein